MGHLTKRLRHQIHPCQSHQSTSFGRFHSRTDTKLNLHRHSLRYMGITGKWIYRKKTVVEQELSLKTQKACNVAEYEAFLAGLDLAKELKIQNLIVSTDSQLVANQVQGLYDVKEQNLKDYKEAALSAINFNSVKINLVKRDLIEEADS